MEESQTESKEESSKALGKEKMSRIRESENDIECCRWNDIEEKS